MFRLNKKGIIVELLKFIKKKELLLKKNIIKNLELLKKYNCTLNNLMLE